MQTIINIWKSRTLSLKGKITIIRSLILPQIQFLFNMIYIPPKILEQIDSILTQFLWNNKPAKVKKSTIIAPVEKGGLNMVDTFSVHTTAKCRWICKLFDGTDKKWKDSFLCMLNIPIDKLKNNLNTKLLVNCKTEFHKQTLKAWLTTYATEPINHKEIILQYICENQFIKVNGVTNLKMTIYYYIILNI